MRLIRNLKKFFNLVWSFDSNLKSTIQKIQEVNRLLNEFIDKETSLSYAELDREQDKKFEEKQSSDRVFQDVYFAHKIERSIFRICVSSACYYTKKGTKTTSVTLEKNFLISEIVSQLSRHNNRNYNSIIYSDLYVNHTNMELFQLVIMGNKLQEQVLTMLNRIEEDKPWEKDVTNYAKYL